jgi:hypothetical protein
MNSHRQFRLVALALLLASGCQQAGNAKINSSVDLSITPSPPVVGEAGIDLVLTGPEGQPLEMESVQVEGNMNHAGMKPVFSTLRQTSPGRYEGTLEFTMAGDWFLIITGRLPDGRRIEETVDVPGVRRP